MRDFYMAMVQANEGRVPVALANVYKDGDSVFNGGYRDGNGLAEQYGTISMMMHLAAAYFCEEGRYHNDPRLLSTIEGYIAFYFNTVRPNGTGDCLITDFYTPSSFDCIDCARAYRIFAKYARTDRERKIQADIRRILERMGEGFLNGGHRTPNHRWMMSAASSMVYTITGRRELKDLAMKYLDEGIDIDEYGEFTERSPGMYNEVNDNALLILAEELGLPELYEPIRKNMDLLFSYIEPDGSIFTQNSARKDKGETDPSMGFFPTRYFYIYLQGAYKLKDPRYAEFAYQIMEQTLRYRRGVPDALWLYMIEDGLKTFVPERAALPRSYEMYNPSSSIYRKVDDDFSVSVIGNNANFLFVQKGDLKLSMRLCASFFMKAQFASERVEREGEGLKLRYSAEDMYWKAFDTKPPTSVWKEMDHAKRRTCNLRTLTFDVFVRVARRAVKVDFRVDGTDRVPFKAEFVVPAGSLVEGESFTVKGDPGQSIIVHSGEVSVSGGKDRMRIGPAFKKHTYTENMRGSVPKSSKGYTIYFTDFTELSRSVEITCE